MKRIRCLKRKEEKDLCDKGKQLCTQRASGTLIMGTVKAFKMCRPIYFPVPSQKKA
jgi:hypothetical protein